MEILIFLTLVDFWPQSYLSFEKTIQLHFFIYKVNKTVAPETFNYFPDPVLFLKLMKKLKWNHIVEWSKIVPWMNDHKIKFDHLFFYISIFLHWLLKFETIILQVRVIFVFFPYSLLEVFDNFSAFLKSTLPLLGNRNYTYLNLYSCSLISSYFLLGPRFFCGDVLF